MIYLEDSDNGIIPRVDLNNDNQIIINLLDPGYPSVREVTDPYVDGSGVLDSTQFHDSRLVTLRGVVVAGALPRSQVMDRMLAHMVPTARSFLHWDLNDDGGNRRCVQFRPGRMNRPIQNFNRIYFSMGLVVPKGVVESSLLQSKTINSSVSGGTESGRSYNLSFDRTYPASDPLGSSSVENEGSVTAWPVIKIFGPCTNPQVDNVTIGKTYDFPSLSVADGEVITIDTVQRTIQNASAVSKMPDLDLTASEWWGLEPGENILAFQPTTSSGASRCTVEYRHAYM